MSGKSLFMIVPPGEHTLASPNFGDRALHSGMRRLVAACSADTVLYDVWNSFPYMTLKRLLDGDANAQLESWHERLLKQCATPAPVRQALSSGLLGSRGAWLPVWPLLDRLAHQRTGQTGREAVEPRLFPGLAARLFGEKLAASDAVLMNAGGLLADHLGHYMPGRVFALRAAQAYGRPTALINYTFAVTRPELLSWVVPVLRRVDLHAVRESASRERLLSLGIPGERIHVVPDAAIAAGKPTKVTGKRTSPTIAIQVRGDRAFDVDAWVSLIEELRARYGARVVYLCGCLKHDPPVLARLRAATTLERDENEPSETALKQAIGSADLLITDRYHGMIFATQMSTPFLPLASTSHKSSGYIADIDYPIRLQPALTTDTLAPTLSLLDKVFIGKEQIASQLSATGAVLESRVFEEYGEVLDILLSMARSHACLGSNTP